MGKFQASATTAQDRQKQWNNSSNNLCIETFSLTWFGGPVTGKFSSLRFLLSFGRSDIAQGNG